MALVALFLALFVQAAVAQPAWRPLGTSSNGRPAFYDPASVVRAGPVTRVAMRFNEEAMYSLTNVELRCRAYEARILGIVTYSSAGAELNRNELATPFRAIIVGSFLENLAREVCGETTAPQQPQ